MKSSIFGGITVALSFTMILQWAQILLLTLGIISAFIPLIKTIIDVVKNRAKFDDLMEDLKSAREEIAYLEKKYTEADHD